MNGWILTAAVTLGGGVGATVWGVATGPLRRRVVAQNLCTALASLLTLAALAYSWHYFDEPPRGHAGSFPALLLLFQGGMCGFAIAGDLFKAFVWFELMSVVAYALTGHRVEEARAVQGALTFAVVTSLGAYAMLMGIGLLYARTGELGMHRIGRGLDAHGRPHAVVLAAFVLVMTGLLVKAAAVPFHFWLPDAHAVAPTPVCMLLSGVMVELGAFGVWRVYGTVFSGPGGVPAPEFERVLVVLGALTAVIGAVMCWYQRHIERLLAYSTVAHTGLFLVGIGVLKPEADDGIALYVLGHAAVKAALFACTGILLDRYGSVDEHALYGRARELKGVAVLFVLGALGLAGLPPFGTALGKSVTEEAVGGPLTVLYVAASAVTAAAVLRVGARVFGGLGPRPEAGSGYGTTGSGERPETRHRLGRIPDPGHHDRGARRTARRSRHRRRGPRFREGGRALRERDRIRGGVHLRPLDPGRGPAGPGLDPAGRGPRPPRRPPPEAVRRTGPGAAATASAVRARRRLRGMGADRHHRARRPHPAGHARRLISCRR